MSENKRSMVPGILLIIFGLWLLTHQHPHLFGYGSRMNPLILFLLAILLFVDALRRAYSGTLFWSIVIFVLGLFFFLRNYGIIPYFYLDEYWPIILIFIGLGFIISGVRLRKR